MTHSQYTRTEHHFNTLNSVWLYSSTPVYYNDLQSHYPVSPRSVWFLSWFLPCVTTEVLLAMSGLLISDPNTSLHPDFYNAVLWHCLLLKRAIQIQPIRIDFHWKRILWCLHFPKFSQSSVSALFSSGLLRVKWLISLYCGESQPSSWTGCFIWALAIVANLCTSPGKFIHRTADQ